MDTSISKQCKSLEEDLKAFQVVGECHIFNKKPRVDGYAYVTLRLPDEEGGVRKTSTSCHRAALLLKKYKEGELQTLQIDKSLECSHLCNNKLCINTQHLVFERKSTNLSRKVCFRNRACQTTHLLVLLS